MKKILLCLLTSLTIAFTIFGTSAFASSDVDYLESTTVLNTLGILENQVGDDALRNSNLTKIEAVNLLVSIFGANSMVAHDDKSIFADVYKNSTNFTQISIANRLGIVKSTDGVNFSPDSDISVNEFARMLIRACGYDFKAAKYNYSLSGYERLAQELDIYDRNDISSDGYIKKGQAYNAIYQALLLDYVVTYNDKNEQTSYINNGQTILEAYYNCKSVEGIYYANEYSSMCGNSSLKENDFEVRDDDGSDYKFHGNSDYYQYFGYRVKVFYRIENQQNVVLTIVKNDNNELTINGDDFGYYDKNDRTFYYTQKNQIDSVTEKESNKKLKISNADINVIYNGQFTENPADVFNILENCGAESGNSIESVIFADNDNDSKYDVIFVNVYYDLFVNYINTDTDTIVDTYGKSFVFDDDNYDILLTSAGEKTEFSKIGAGNILRIKEGLGDPKFSIITISNQTVLARIEKKTVEDGKTTVEVVLGEQSSRGGQFQGSFVGGMDGDLPRARYYIANSFEKYVDDLMMNAYSFYTFSLNADNEIAGYEMFVFPQAASSYITQRPFGSTSYNNTNIGIMLGVAKESVLKDKVKLKLFDKPHELRIYSVHDYDTTEDFIIENIEASCLFFDNPEEFYKSDKDGVVDQEKVDLYYKLKDEYAKYGNDGSKYSLDVLRFIFGRKFVTFKLNDKFEIYAVQLPGYNVKDGELAYASYPGQSYLKKGTRYFSLYDGSQVVIPYHVIGFVAPDPNCSFADNYDLCQSVIFTSSIDDDNTCKADFYSFNLDSANVQIAVCYVDCDAISNKVGSSSGIVLSETKSSSPYGYPVDNYYLFGADLMDFGARRFYNIYPETYNATGTNGKLSDKKFQYVNSYSALNNYSYIYTDINSIPESSRVLNIDSGDIASFFYPNSKAVSRAAERFYCAKLIYDRSEDKFTDGISATLTTLGDKKYSMGRIYEVSKESVAFLPSYYEDDQNYEPSLNDCYIAYSNKVNIILCEKTKNGDYTARYGEYADLYESELNNYRVVAYIPSTSNTQSSTNTNFWIYVD